MRPSLNSWLERARFAQWLIVGAILIMASDEQASAWASSSAGQATVNANSAGPLQFPSNHQTASDSPQPNQSHKKNSKLVGEPPSINLIPVDQPLGSANLAGHKRTHSVVFEDDPSFNVASIGEESPEPMSVQDQPEQMVAIEPSQRERQNVVFESNGDFGAGQHEQPAEVDEKSMPTPDGEARFGSSKGSKLAADSDTLQSAQLSPVERRFGLFKKHHPQPASAHYGAPQPLMSAINYAAATNSYGLSDCERCMVSLNGGASPISGALQETPMEPSVTPSTPPLIPVQPPGPVMPQPGFSHPAYSYQHPHQHQHQHPLAPLKHKLLMKFPFFIKSSGVHNELHPGFMQVSPQLPPPSAPMSGPNEAYSWHYQPARPAPQASNALYLKPAASQATTAYHCVQAYGPLLQPAQHFGGPFLGTSQQETSNVVSVSPGPSKSQPSHQQQQQQLQSAKQYQQQQQQHLSSY